ncbi:hypothetical protein [Amycolatopsis sp. NPDC051102]|uniref:hypothetical protein n=1 Tax=Amycolatopsis sp. NPDC051102 TaxID=3155163 RepID=UPI00342B408E
MAGLVAILVAVLAEVFRRLAARRESRAASRLTYENYANPLAVSAADLFYRMREIFAADGSGFFLSGEVHVTTFERYKVLSTLYRMASLLAWIRALRRELLLLQPKVSRKKELEEALNAFGEALAEGGHIEATRLCGLAEVWGLGATSGESSRRAGIQVDHELKQALHAGTVARFCDLDEVAQLEALERIHAVVAAAAGADVLDRAGLVGSRSRVAGLLSVREAWIYRDWQAAIGDVLLRETSSGPRRFQVIGYRDFETLVEDGDEADRRWLRRLYTVIDDVDVHADRTSDARIGQLLAVYVATAGLIKVLSAAGGRRSPISGDLLTCAKSVVRNPAG